MVTATHFIRQQIFIKYPLWTSHFARLHGDTENDIVESCPSRTIQSGWAGKKLNKEGSCWELASSDSHFLCQERPLSPPSSRLAPVLAESRYKVQNTSCSHCILLSDSPLNPSPCGIIFLARALHPNCFPDPVSLRSPD